MTVTLRCSHCNQPMTIAPRKPGSRLSCPGCGRDVVVPASESPARVASGSAAPGRVAELPATAPRRGVLPAATQTRTDPARSRASADSPPTESIPWLPKPAPIQRLPEPAGSYVEGFDRQEGIVLSKSTVTLSLIFVLLALVCAFLAGFLSGKYL